MEQALIVNLITDEKIPCMFRPNEYTLTKTNTWNKKDVKEGNVPKLEFGGGQPINMTMELFFDTYEKGEDVRNHTKKIWKLMQVPKDGLEPPHCQFMWGKSWSFKAVITSINQKFTLFLPDGTPVRSTLNVTFQQAFEDGWYPGQNPTTVSKEGYKTRRVREGETLDLIAHEEYGDASQWRFLADINHLETPKKLKAGQTLVVAPLE
ncbi:MAG: LysM peptidoglycan-binding domain-containing protein [Dehalococcoidia bacterium]|nr:LysM peptidoglycan-binding domain-containing protein [Dehalococcoidia bacterium]